jgi:hypothetical protein
MQLDRQVKSEPVFKYWGSIIAKIMSHDFNMHCKLNHERHQHNTTNKMPTFCSSNLKSSVFFKGRVYRFIALLKPLGQHRSFFLSQCNQEKEGLVRKGTFISTAPPINLNKMVTLSTDFSNILPEMRDHL